jgi:hypothetical protein
MAMLDVEVRHLTRHVLAAGILAGLSAGAVIGWLVRGALQ